MADCLKNFFTGYVSEADIVVLDQKQIALRYLKGWFFLDFFSSIPVDPIFKAIAAAGEADSDDNSKIPTAPTKLLKIVRLFRLAKLVRLLRASRIFRYVRYAKQTFESTFHILIPPWSTKLASLLAMILLAGHWLGSVQFMVSLCGQPNQTTCVLDGALMQVSKMMNFPKGSWAEASGLNNAAALTQYSWSLFKMLYQLIGGEVGSTCHRDTADFGWYSLQERQGQF